MYHKRQHRPDKHMTKLMHDEGELKSRHSYISFRIHPGTKEQCTYLAGEDCADWRKRVFDRAKGICFYCGEFCGLIQGEAHHKAHKTKIDRCWCDSNGAWTHPACHRKQHPQVQWRKRVEAA